MPPCDLDKISMQAIAGIKLTSSVLEVKILITGPPGKSQRAKVVAAPNVKSMLYLWKNSDGDESFKMYSVPIRWRHTNFYRQ